VVSRYPSGGSSAPLTTRRYLDGWGRPYEVHEPASATDFFIETLGYDDRGQLACASLPRRGTGALAGVCSSHSPNRSFQYDKLRREVSRALAGQTTTTTAYSIANLDGQSGNELIQEIVDLTGVSQTTSPDRVRRMGLDRNGEVVAVLEVGANGGLTVLRRDPRGRLTTVDGPDISYSDGVVDANLLEIGYDFLGRRLRVTTPGNYSLVSDGCGGSSPRCNNPIPANRPPWSFVYDPNGNLISKSSPKGTVIGYVYDGLDRLLIKNLAGSPTVPGPEDTVYTYDLTAALAVGRLAQVVGPDVETSYAYSLAGRLSEKSREIRGHTFDFLYEHDNQGRLVSEVFPDLTEAAYSFDGDLLSAIQLTDGPGGATTTLAGSIGYHASGSIASIAFPTTAGLTVGTYAYDPNTHRPATSSTARPTGGYVQDVTYTFDRAGNLLSSTDSQGTAQTFSYDQHHRLLEAVSSGPNSYGTIANVYDAAGNLRKIGSQDLLYHCSPGGPHAVTHVVQSGQTQRSYDYNRDGDVTEIGPLASLKYLNRDDEGRIAALQVGSKTAVYAYDESGERVLKEYMNPGAGDVDRLYLDEGYEVDLTSEHHDRHFFVRGRRVATVRRDGVGTAADPGLPASETRRYYHPDQVGSNVVVTTGTGTVLQKSVFTPFGKLVAMVDGAGGSVTYSANSARHLFADQEFDGESGLAYFHARYYDPAVGRFMERDPDVIEGGISLAQVAGEAQTSNLYAYALNRPTVLMDRSGRFWSDTHGYQPPVITTADTGGVFVSGPSTPYGQPSMAVALPLIPIAVELGKAAFVVVTAIATGATLEELWTLLSEMNEEGSEDEPAPEGGETDAPPPPVPPEAPGKRYTEAQDAVIQLAKEGARKGGLTAEEAAVLGEMAREVGLPVRGPESHPDRPYSGEHIHIGPVNHIPVK
jgi:RHS repeat-associated protein